QRRRRQSSTISFPGTAKKTCPFRRSPCISSSTRLCWTPPHETEAALNHQAGPGMNEQASHERGIRSDLPRIDYDLIRCHGHAALVTVLISALLGILVATKFNFP